MITFNLLITATWLSFWKTCSLISLLYLIMYIICDLRLDPRGGKFDGSIHLRQAVHQVWMSQLVLNYFCLFIFYIYP